MFSSGCSWPVLLGMFTCHTWAQPLRHHLTDLFVLPHRMETQLLSHRYWSRIVRAEHKCALGCSRFAREAFREPALLMKTEIRGDHGRQSGSVGADCWQDDPGCHERAWHSPTQGQQGIIFSRLAASHRLWWPEGGLELSGVGEQGKYQLLSVLGLLLKERKDDILQCKIWLKTKASLV